MKQLKIRNRYSRRRGVARKVIGMRAVEKSAAIQFRETSLPWK